MRRIINIFYNTLSKNEEYKHPEELNDECLSKYQEKGEKTKKE